jgi:cell division protein FtsB
MIVRRKIVAPVTPRIVQANSGQRFLRYALLFCALLFAAWFSYDYGRTQAPANGEAPIAQSGESEQAITELEQERDSLRQQVAELQQSMKQTRQDLVAAQARIQSLQQAESSQREASQPAPAPTSALQSEPAPEPEPVTTVTEAANNTLKLENVHIEATQSENVFRIGFSVMQDGAGSGRVTGTIWIAVNGFSDGEPRRLSFKRLSPDRRSYVKMGFDLQQDVTEDVVLPENFHPKNVLIEAKPYGDDYTGTAVKIDWFTAG